MSNPVILNDVMRMAGLLRNQYGYRDMTAEIVLEAGIRLLFESNGSEAEKEQASGMINDIFHCAPAFLISFLEEFNTDLREKGDPLEEEQFRDENPASLSIVIGRLLDQTKERLLPLFLKWQEKHPAVSALEVRKENNLEPVKEVKKEEPVILLPEEKRAAAAVLTARADALQKKLFETVRGQNQAVSFLVSGWLEGEIRSLAGEADERPRATVLFAGPHGSGMTLLVHTFARQINEKCYVFNGSAQDNGSMTAAAMISLILKGSHSTAPGEPARRKCIFMIDHMNPGTSPYGLQEFLASIMNGDLQNEGSVSFRDCMFIFTTNAGASTLYENPDITDPSVLRADEITEALKKETFTGKDGRKYPAFVPEFLDICAEGKVALFGNVSAAVMREIARHTLMTQSEELQKNMGIEGDIDEHLADAVLFHLGEKAMPDTVRNYAVDFFNRQITELFRISKESLPAVRRISFHVNIPSEGEAADLFIQKKQPEALLFTDNEEGFEEGTSFHFTRTDSLKKAQRIIMKTDIRLILLDFAAGLREKRYRNIEDIDAAGRDLFLWLRKEHADIPVYLIENGGHIYTEEEKLSFLRKGAAGFMKLQNDSMDIREISADLYLEDAMLNLEKGRGRLSWGTRQQIDEQGNAVIELFDLNIRHESLVTAGEGAVSNIQMPDMKFDDIIGAEDAKEELKFFISYLRNPRAFMGSGLQAPKGVLLYGPPGTGKTMLAKAVASEAGIAFIACDGSEFLKKYVGEGPELVHRYFQRARKFAPSVLFIDEIDAIGLNRASDEARYSRDILTSFFTEMDGFHTSSTKPVFVIAATNASVEPGRPGSLDPALLRRFDRRIFVDLPDLKGRTEYLHKEMKKYPSIRLNDSQIHTVAENTSGLSLAVIAQILDLAKRLALRQSKKIIDEKLITEAMEQYTSGDRRTRSEEENLRTARHEAGHAFLQWQAGRHPAYISIESRSDHHGYVRGSEEDFEKMNAKKEILDYIRMCLGGRAAELVYYGQDNGLTMGPSEDLRQATNAAVRLFCTFGMDAEFGLASVDPDKLSAKKKEELLDRVNALLAEQLKEAEDKIRENKPVIDAFCRILLVREHLNGDEIEDIFRQETEKTA